MRVQYYCAATLDGFIADEQDGLDWLTGYRPPDPPPDLKRDTSSYDEFYAGVGALIMGSATYEWILENASDWPYPGKPTWVLSSRELPQPEGDADVRVVDASVDELRDELTAAAGENNLWIVGGGPVASQFAEAGFLDDVIVTLVPVILGRGKPLFERALESGPMRLADARPSPTGMVQVRYEITRPGAAPSRSSR
jgi:dihydrofolate reductase